MPNLTIAEWLASSTAELGSVGIESARLDCLLILEKALSRDRAKILAEQSQKLSAEKLYLLKQLLRRRKSYEPMAYLIGSKEFYGLDFIVNTDVLIPRPDSENLLNLFDDIFNDYLPESVLDIGTGSGCLAISVKKKYPSINVMAVDNNHSALKVASMNAHLHNVRITFSRSDLLGGIKLKKMDVIVANLPYLSNYLASHSSLSHEPKNALVGGSDGLDLYRRLFSQLKSREPAYVFTESLASQHQELTQIAAEANFNQILKDGLIQVFTKKPAFQQVSR